MFAIKKCRERVGISQKELAEKSGVGRVTLSGLESGRITVTSTGTILKIAKALGVQVSEIFFEGNA